MLNRRINDLALTDNNLFGFIYRALFVAMFLLITSALIMLAMYLPHLYVAYTGEFRTLDGLIIYVMSGVGCFLFLPYLLCRYVYRVKLKDLGLRFPVITFKNALIILLAACLLLPFAYLFSLHPYLRQAYSLTNLSLPVFLFFILVLQPIYYYAEEFFFRGFLFVTLWERIGWHSFWITDIMFLYAHIDKPVPEFFLCIPASVVLNYLVLRTGSVYPALLVHWGLGSLLNLIVYFD